MSGDYLGLDGPCSADELAWRDRVRGSVDARFRPDIAGWVEDAHFPRELVPEMGELGLLGMHLSGSGCAGRRAGISLEHSPLRHADRAITGLAAFEAAP